MAMAAAKQTWLPAIAAIVSCSLRRNKRECDRLLGSRAPWTFDHTNFTLHHFADFLESS